MLGNRKLLDKILEYHIIPGYAITISQLKASQTFPTLLGGKTGNLTINCDLKMLGYMGSVSLRTSSGGKANVGVGKHLFGCFLLLWDHCLLLWCHDASIEMRGTMQVWTTYPDAMAGKAIVQDIDAVLLPKT